VVVHVPRSLVLVQILCLLLLHVRLLSPVAEPEKFSNSSGGDLTVYFPHCRRRSASGKACSTNPRMTYYMALKTLVDCFVCSNLVHPCDRFADPCSYNHLDYFLRCFAEANRYLAGTVILRIVAETSPILDVISVAIFFG
jgi:hypothetical protein